MTEALLTPADDSFHPPASEDRWWTETCWFSFDQPGADLSATFYPLYRPNLGVCSLAVYLWDASGSEPWQARYGRSFWHLAMSMTDWAVVGGRPCFGEDQDIWSADRVSDLRGG